MVILKWYHFAFNHIYKLYSVELPTPILSTPKLKLRAQNFQITTETYQNFSHTYQI